MHFIFMREFDRKIVNIVNKIMNSESKGRIQLRQFCSTTKLALLFFISVREERSKSWKDLTLVVVVVETKKLSKWNTA